MTWSWIECKAFLSDRIDCLITFVCLDDVYEAPPLWFVWNVHSSIHKKLWSYEKPNKEIYSQKIKKYLKNALRAAVLLMQQLLCSVLYQVFIHWYQMLQSLHPKRPKWSVIITDKLFNNMSWQNNFLPHELSSVEKLMQSFLPPTARLDLVTVSGEFSTFICFPLVSSSVLVGSLFSFSPFILF